MHKEARRLSNLPEVKTFIEGFCELTINPDAFGEEEKWIYKIQGRQQNRRLTRFKEIIRDNLLPAFKNGKTPLNWGNLEAKIDALVPLLLIVSVPKDKQPWRPVPPLPPQAGGNQGQGQGQGGNPNN